MTQTIRKWLVAAVMLAAAGLKAEPLKFDFKDPKGVNTVTFSLDAPLEAINGSANGISGEVTFDPQKPAETKGRIVVEAASMQVPNSIMKGHLQGKDWMDVTTHPTITFEIASLAGVKTSGDSITADATGKLIIKGVAKTVTVPVKLTYLKGRLAERIPQAKGDLLVVRTKFPVKRSDFGVNPKAPADKVSDEVQLSLAIAGAAPGN